MPLTAPASHMSQGRFTDSGVRTMMVQPASRTSSSIQRNQSMPGSMSRDENLGFTASPKTPTSRSLTAVASRASLCAWLRKTRTH